ncbi:MAG: alpha/beta hydrolase [Burkholderiaceae bacterium]
MTIRESKSSLGRRSDIDGAGAIEPITGRYVHVPIAGQLNRIYFEESGQGRPLVCLHTAGSHGSQFRHLMTDPAVTDNFRVLAFDLPWHGKSNPPPGWMDTDYQLTSDYYVDAIISFCQSLSLEQPVIMGCSMGGRVVFRLAAEFGDQIGALIGLEATDRPAPWWDDSWLGSPQFARGDFCAALVSGLMAPQSPQADREETLWHYTQGGSNIFEGDMHFFRTDSEYGDLTERIDTKQCPMYLLTGEYDYSCRAENTEATAARIPGARVTIMKELGHFPMSENPGKFRDYILPVLNEILSR